MSVVEKTAPRRTIIGLSLAVAVVLVLALVVAIRGTGNSSSTQQSASTTTRPAVSTTIAGATTSRVFSIDAVFDRDASYRVYLQRTGAGGSLRVFGYVDPSRSELRYIDRDPVIYGSIVGRFADRLVIESSSLRIIDRDFATAPVSINGDDFVGSWHDHAIVAEYFPERTTFHEYRVDGSEARSVGLVGRRPDVIGGIVRDSVVLERGGRLLLVGLADATVREFAVGSLVGVGGDRIFYTSCTTQGACTIDQATLDGIERTTAVGGYVDPDSGVVAGRVAPDGSAVIVHDYRSGQDVALEHGTRTPLVAQVADVRYAWAPTGRLIYRVDADTRRLDAIDTRSRGTIAIPLPSEDTISLQSVAAW